MDDEIYIAESGLRGVVGDLNGLYTRIKTLTTNLERIKRDLQGVWEDEAFLDFSSEYDIGLDNLYGLMVAVSAISELCESACDGYTAADSKVLSLL